jgi:chemotaxis protein MotB
MLLERKKRHKVNHEGSWAVSYVDMLTLLLCFFIIFFNSKAIVPEEDVFKKVIRSMTTTGKDAGSFSETTAGKGPTGTAGTGTGTGTGVGTGTGTGSGVGTGSSASQGTPADVMEQIKVSFDSIAKAKTVVLNKALILDFDNISFFKSGSTQLSPEGKEVITKIIESLGEHQAYIKITVQGHTDSIQVKPSKTQFSDNWELSVLRATAVLKSFVKAGFGPQTLTAEGYADTQANGTASRALDRKITFKIEMRNQP